MPTQPGGYRCKDGKRVPGVTTITGAFKDSGGLIHWSWKLAYEPLMEARALLIQLQDGGPDPITLANFLDRDAVKFDYREARKGAADAGTCAHDMVYCHAHGKTFNASRYTQTMVEAARPAFEAYQQWAQGSSFEVLEAEIPLISEVHRYGGTRDAVLVDGKRALGDWKTSNDIYPEYLCQLAAYAILDEEHGAVIDGGFHLLKFSKQEKPDDPIRFTHHYWSQLDKAKEAFLIQRKLYDLMADLKRLAK